MRTARMASADRPADSDRPPRLYASRLDASCTAGMPATQRDKEEPLVILELGADGELSDHTGLRR